MIYTCYKCSFAWIVGEGKEYHNCPTCNATEEYFLKEPGDDILKRRIRVSWPEPISDWPKYNTEWHPAKKFPAHTRNGRIRRLVVAYDDAKVTRDFYSNVFGWDIVDCENTDPENPLMFCATGPGSANWEPSVPSFCYAYLRPRKADPTGSDARFMIEVDNIEATLDKVVAAGGEVLRQRYEEDGKQFAMFKDSEGNPWYIWETPDTVTWDEPESQSN
ncbi:MAG: VOC family protein [Clostridia bacterium]|nr:VOC family protein [Clostridia bacterium]